MALSVSYVMVTRLHLRWVSEACNMQIQCCTVQFDGLPVQFCNFIVHFQTNCPDVTLSSMSFATLLVFVFVCVCDLYVIN